MKEIKITFHFKISVYRKYNFFNSQINVFSFKMLCGYFYFMTVKLHDDIIQLELPGPARAFISWGGGGVTISEGHIMWIA